MSIRTPSELGRVYEPDLAIARRLPSCGGSAPRARSRRAALARVDGRRARRLRGEPPATSRWRATSISARSWRSSARGFRETRCRRAAPATSPSGHIASPSSRSSARRRARAGLDGLRPAGRGRRAADPPRARRRLLHRRRRLRHELARARNRCAVRPADRRAPREQRHVRDDPHAPGAAVSGARRRHRSREPGLPGARARVRGARRTGRANRGLRGCVRACPRLGKPVGARVARRSRSGSARACG